jgi:hypothetical protein
MSFEQMIAERNSATAPQPRNLRPLQNRVDPFGELRAVAERGGLMGNRGGRLHRDDRTLTGRRWTSKRWICCVLAFKGRWREVWAKGYTELFFLDEPTALAAGHRPCFECRRAAAKAFLAAFPGGPSGADAMDEALHRERVENRSKRLWRARLGELPEGAMIARRGRAYAVRSGTLWPWSFAGYGAPLPLDPDDVADVLTPPSTIAALAGGYRPIWAEALDASP